eukprot:COSAG04_NODE_32122_length_253_cov_0.616883_1_plen_43_part_01
MLAPVLALAQQPAAVLLRQNEQPFDVAATAAATGDGVSACVPY